MTYIRHSLFTRILWYELAMFYFRDQLFTCVTSHVNSDGTVGTLIDRPTDRHVLMLWLHANPLDNNNNIQILTTLLLLHPFNSLFPSTTTVSWYQTGKTSLDLNEARADEVWGCSDISWTICKQSAPRCRQITTSTPHHSVLQAGCSSRCPTNQ